MRPLRIVTAILLGWALGMPASGQAAENPATSPPMPSVETQNQKQTPDIDMPVYKPPKRSSPKGRVGGGIRGGDGPSLYVLAPDHVGFTKDEQPTLYWYLSKTTSLPLEFSLLDTRLGVEKKVQRLNSPAQPGVQSISLKGLEIKLEPSVQYMWYVTLVVGPKKTSKDVVVGGTIERITKVEELTLCQSKNGDAVFRYAECGLWYNAIALLSAMIDKTPDDLTRRKQRACLLLQIGLWEPARADYPELRDTDCKVSAHGLD